jgi:hypothetical protein
VKSRIRRTLLIAAPFFTGVAVALTLFACCCPKVAPSAFPPPSEPPPIGMAHFDVPKDAAPAAHTQAEMHNVLFHVDQSIALNIHTLRGEMYDKVEGQPLNFDDKRTFVVKIDRGRIGVSGAALSDLMNHYVFHYEGAPLKNLVLHVHEGRLVQEGVMHKILDIPFEMTADVSTTDEGWMRIHPIGMKICSLDGQKLMKAFGITLDKVLKKLPQGVRVEKNDLLIDPLKILPPPTIEGRLADIELHEDELVQIFDSGAKAEPLATNVAEPNWMLFREGTLRMGKLFMVRADMLVVDPDPRDPFDFFVDYYNNQLTEGFTRNQADYSLKVYMRDYADVGKPPQPGEKLAQ